MCLNPSKSESLMLGTRQRLASTSTDINTTPIEVAGCRIEPSIELKSLGVTIDSYLTLDSHVNNICKAANFHLRALRHIRGSISTDIAKTVACAMIGSRIDYCNSLLVGTSKKNIMKLQRIQNSAARIVFNIGKFEHIKPALKKLHWLPIAERITHKLATLVFKTKFYGEPSYLAPLLVDYVPPRELRSSSHNLLSLPPRWSATRSHSFSIAGPSIWNQLPDDIKNSKSVAGFKAKLKTHLFGRAYNCTV
jgi:hypothetical protein